MSPMPPPARRVIVERDESRGVRRRPGHVVAVVAWAALGVVALVLDDPVDHQASQVCMASVALAFGVWGFWVHGRNRITAAGLYCLASGIFVGYAGLWWWDLDVPVTSDIFMSTTVGFGVNLVMYAALWRPRDHPSGPRAETGPDLVRWGVLCGAAVAVTGLAVGFVFPSSSNSLLPEAVFAGLSLVVVSVALSGSTRVRLVRTAVVGGMALAVYYATTFSGYGRLILVSLALVPAVYLSGQFPVRTIKLGLLLAIAPALAILSTSREELGVAKYGRPLSGLGSVVEPMRDFGRLVAIHDSGGFDFAHGDTFLATLVVVVPRTWWEDKPIGFGAVLTQIFAPELQAVGQSYAALNQSEWYFNFGWPGVLLMVPLIGWLIRGFDRALTRASGWQITSRMRLLGLTAALLIVADVPNLQWVGSFGYVSRTGLRLIILLLLVPLAIGRRGDSAGRSTASPVLLSDDRTEEVKSSAKNSHLPPRKRGVDPVSWTSACAAETATSIRS